MNFEHVGEYVVLGEEEGTNLDSNLCSKLHCYRKVGLYLEGMRVVLCYIVYKLGTERDCWQVGVTEQGEYIVHFDLEVIQNSYYRLTRNLGM
jgi:hypothetical protein